MRPACAVRTLHSVTAHIADLLARLTAPGTFATRIDVPVGDLAIEVAGVGRLALPISPRAIETLSGVARPSPFGLRDKTLLDSKVRRSWEIAPAEVRIRGRGWQTALAKHLRKIAIDLGLPPGSTLDAVFDKLLVYEKGQFFKPHQDSERSDDLVASLVVMLPSQYRGGELIVEHHGETRVFRRSEGRAQALSLIAFYADCRHEIRPVTGGARVALTYQLRLADGAAGDDCGAAPNDAPAGLVRALAESAREHFSRPIVDRYVRSKSAPAERLVVLLDHEYTQRSLAWNRLKGADRVRAAALAAVAEQLDCERFLALADVHETWSCAYDDGEFYGRPRRRYGRGSWGYPDDEDELEDSDDEEEADARGAEDYEVGDLKDSEIDLHHWVDARGKRTAGVAELIRDEELVFTKPSSELEPVRVEHEDYQGNYGNTVDRWYHRAALVMWPRSRSFVLRARASPEWAVDRLLEIDPSDTAELESKVAALLPSWERTARDVKGARFAARMTKVATRIHQPSLARGWLDPLGLERLESAAVRRDLVQLVDRHGLDWAKGLFTEWMEKRPFGVPSYAPVLPKVCVELTSHGSDPCQALATWWVEREAEAALRNRDQDPTRSSTWLELDAVAPPSTHLAHVFDAAIAIGEPSVVDAAMLRLLGKPRPASLPFLVELLRACAAHAGALRNHMAGSALRRACTEQLEGIARRAPRTPDDWSIETPLRCSCADCAVLTRFLRSDRADLDWPLPQDRRQHVHIQIDATMLPVLHTTRREGRPYTLQLRKHRNLFRREAEHRARAEAMLRELSSALGPNVRLSRRGRDASNRRRAR